jgi:hypothetical protein
MTTSKASLFAGILLASVVAYADCPEGGRATTPAEQQLYVEATSTIKAAMPPAPAGWTLRDRNPATVVAPTDVCKDRP